jgi:hypothetical protein
MRRRDSDETTRYLGMMMMRFSAMILVRLRFVVAIAVGVR